MARGSSVRTTTTRYRTLDMPALQECPGCAEALPHDATFCTQCGLRLFEIIALDDDDLEEIEID